MLHDVFLNLKAFHFRSLKSISISTLFIDTGPTKMPSLSQLLWLTLTLI